MTDPAAQPQASFEALYEEGFGYVYQSLRRLGVPERHLEDVAHDVFVLVHQKRDQYDPARPLKPWLFAFAFRVASDFRKKAANRREVLDETEPGATTETPLDRLEAKEARDLVIRALDTIDLDRRAVFVMHEIDGLAAPAIAESLGIPTNTVYSRLRSARQKFEKAVRRMSQP